MKYQFKTNIMCGSCVAKVTPHLNGHSDIKNWQVDTQNPGKILSVETDNLTEEEVKELVQKAGYKAEATNQ
ncbi:heavy-metal-associated domain-containing protein [Flavisolibacter sp. BT320]|nr:heavy-metal-associated domain-containing protein [Flavisolibacter longurius]